MNSDHAPTAEEQLPPLRPQAFRYSDDFEVWKKREAILTGQRDAALRENREKDARIAELERKGGELCCVLGNLLIHVHELGLRNTEPYKYRNERAEAAEAKLRAVSDALDEKPGSIPMEGHYVCFEDAVSEYIDGLRAIVEGK